MPRCSHTIVIDEERGRMSVYRTCGDHRQVLYTEYRFDAIRTAGIEAFAQQLGEDLVLDTGELRRLLGL